MVDTASETPLDPALEAAMESAIESSAAPTDRPVETLDARDLPPPQPLSQSLELLVELDDEVILLQRNDRAPQHLYPKLADRGYEYETIERDEETLTVVWRS